ncbi:hypothetical protein F7200_02005 [Helicobacter pylori]|nr:hypothetical protein [Helicobacter pylori]
MPIIIPFLIVFILYPLFCKIFVNPFNLKSFRSMVLNYTMRMLQSIFKRKVNEAKNNTNYHSNSYHCVKMRDKLKKVGMRINHHWNKI